MLFFISLGVDKAIMQNEECQESRATLTFLKAGKNVESNKKLAREKRRRLAIMEIFNFILSSVVLARRSEIQISKSTY